MAVPRIVPVGVTSNGCVATPPLVVRASTTNEFFVRDCAWLGVQDKVSPLSAAPAGPVINLNVTLPPAGSLAEMEYEYGSPSFAAVGAVLLNTGAGGGAGGGVALPPTPPQADIRARVEISATTRQRAREKSRKDGTGVPSTSDVLFYVLSNIIPPP